MKKFTILLAVVMILALALPVSAEYVACVNEGEAHDFSEWTVVATNDNDTVAVERTCSKCDYTQKGVAKSDGQGGVASTDDIATTLSMPITTANAEVAPEPDGPVLTGEAVNPSTGARV